MKIFKASNNLKEFAGTDSGIGINAKHVYLYKIHFIEKNRELKTVNGYNKSLPDLAFTVNNELCCSQIFYSHRSKGMKLGGADTDFRP